MRTSVVEPPALLYNPYLSSNTKTIPYFGDVLLLEGSVGKAVVTVAVTIISILSNPLISSKIQSMNSSETMINGKGDSGIRGEITVFAI